MTLHLIYDDGAADAAKGGVGGATLGTWRAGVARGATENAVRDGVGQLSDP